MFQILSPIPPAKASGAGLLYDHLPWRCIRVLTVEAAQHDDSRLRARMSTIKLDNSTQSRFSALSYVWGSPKDEPRSMLCNDIAVPITPNLHSALRNLRDKLGTYVIWADAICINQDDNKEKEHQIPLMGEIYAKSNFVYVWLGRGSMETKRAMGYLRKPPLIEYIYPSGSIGHGGPQRRVWSALLAYFYAGFRYKSTLFPRRLSRGSSRNRRSLTDVTFDDLAALLDVEWLERMWTYQEILLASRPIIVCGQDHLAWPSFSCSVAFLEYSACFTRFRNQGFLPVTGWYKVAFAREYLRYGNFETERNHLASKETSRNSSLWCYIEFLQTIARYERRLIMALVVVPITTMLYLFIGVELMGITDWENYKRAKRNLAYASAYNDLISSVTSSLISQYSNATASSRAGITAKSSSMPATTLMSYNYTKTTHAATGVVDIITKLQRSPWLDPTAVMDSAVNMISAAVVSVIDSCQSNCTNPAPTPKCFDSCVAHATAMPTTNAVSFRDADLNAHRSQLSYTKTFWIVGIYAFILITSGLVAVILREIREHARMKPVSEPAGLAIDLIDALLYRKSRLPHDKAFALRSVLQRLSKMPISSPDYRRPLNKIFEDLNVQLFRAMGNRSLLTVAAAIPLGGHPSWMADWSKRPDPLWLSGAESRGVRLEDSWRDRSRLDPPFLFSMKYLRCRMAIICRVDRCFRFESPAAFSHSRSLDTMLELASCSYRVLMYMHNCKAYLRNVVSSGAPGVPRGDISNWADFLYNNCHKPGTAWQRLSHDTKLHRTHVAICEEFAQNDRQLFWYSSEQLSEEKVGRKGLRTFYRYLFGICRYTVSKGDVLVAAPDAPTFLILHIPNLGTRGSPHVHSARVLSPAIVRGERLRAEDEKNVLFDMVA